MKGILIFFFVIFAGLGAGVYFYETQIASPNAADALVKSKKKSKKKVATKPSPVVKKSSLSIAKIEDKMPTLSKRSRVVDLLVADSKVPKAQLKKQRAIEQSIRHSIKKSVSLDIQKAVAVEISKRNH